MLKEMIYQSDRKIELLFNDIYKNYHYYILNLGTHPTAYIEIPKKNKLFGMDYDEIYNMGYDIDVHGGFTYSSDHLNISKNTTMQGSWFIGWDYAHAGDYAGYYEEMESYGLCSFSKINNKKWTTEEIIEECKNAIDQIIKVGIDNE